MITFGDIPLLVPDPEGELAEVVNRLLPLEELAVFGSRPLAELSTLPQSRYQSQRHSVGLPIYNWPDPPTPRLNSLYWPSGASRWARGWFICTGEAKELIAAQAHSSGGTAALTLKLGDDSGQVTPISTSMFLLPPRPISGIKPGVTQTAAEKKEAVWLLPLVDARYFWQFISSGLLEPAKTDSWATLFSTLGTALGVTITADTADSDYLNPDPVEFTRRYCPLPLLIDAAAASVGQRITRGLDGTVKSVSVATAKTQLTTTLAEPLLSLAAGSTFDNSLGDLPENIRVNFRRYSQYAVYCGGEVYTKTAAASAVSEPPTSTVSGKDKIILSSLFAEYPAATAPNSGSTPTNGTDLTALANQIAADWYGWASRIFDVAWNGFPSWEMTGFEDAVIWDYCEARTRVWSLPTSVGVSQQLSQDGDYEVLETLELGKPDADIASGASGTVSVWRRNSSGTLADSTLNVTAKALGGPVTASIYVTLFWNCGEWLVSCYEQ